MTQSNLVAVSPDTSPQRWDKVRMGGELSPGYCRWSGWERKTVIDKKKGKGTKGSTQTQAQQPECEGEFTFFWGYTTRDGSETPAIQDAQWDAFAPQLAKAFTAGPTQVASTGAPTVAPSGPQAVAIVHPALMLQLPPVTSVIVESVGPIMIDFDTKMRSVKVKMSEYFPAKSTSIATTPRGVAPASTGATGAQPTINPKVKIFQDLLKKAIGP